MAYLPEEIKQELRSIPIEDVCNLLSLPTSGDCPTGHSSEHHKCWHVNKAGNYWKCFSCLKAGDTISLVSVKNNLSYIESCKYLIDNFRPDLLVDFETINKSSIAFKTQQNHRVYDLLTQCAVFFHQELLKKDNKNKYYDYLILRGLTPETINEKLIGVVSNVSQLIRTLKEQNYTTEDLVSTGLFKMSNNQLDIYSFNEKLFFPYWHEKKVKFFITRNLNETSEKDRFRKAIVHSDKNKDSKIKNILYGLDNLKKARDLNMIIITEGIIDSLLLEQMGFPVISPITINITKFDIEMITSRIINVKNVYIINDNEKNKQGEKGALATARAILLAMNKELLFVEVPMLDETARKIDIADYINKYHKTKKDVLALLETSTRYIQYLIDKKIDCMDLEHFKDNLKNSGIIKLFELLEDPALVRHYKTVLSDKTELSFSDIEKYFIKPLEEEELSIEEGEETFQLKMLLKLENFLNDNYKFKQNVVTSQLEVKEIKTKDEYVIDDVKMNTIFTRVIKQNIIVSMENIMRVIYNNDFSPTYDPIYDYIEALTPPDEIEHDYIKDYTDAIQLIDEREREFFEECFRKWFVGILTAIYPSEYCNQLVMILIGRQGLRKSYFLNKLIPERLRKYLKVGLERNDKDIAKALSDHLLINIDEFESFNKQDIDFLKSIITQTEFDLRLPYRRNNSILKKRASFMASSNNSGILRDMTGNRRFLPFEVRNIDITAKFNIDAMYWQARNLFKSGYRYHFDDEEIEFVNNRNEKFEPEDVFADAIQRYLKPSPIFSVNKAKGMDLLSSSEVFNYLTTKDENLKRANLDVAVKKIGSLLKNKFKYIRKADHTDGNRYKYAVIKLLEVPDMYFGYEKSNSENSENSGDKAEGEFPF